MFCSRCVLPFLAFYLLLEEMSAFVLPNRLRSKRDATWLDQEFFPSLPDRTEPGDLSLGDAMDTGRNLGGHHSQSAIQFLTPLENLSVHHNSQHRHHRKNTEKRKKIAPLDPIDSSLMTSHRGRKDEPDDQLEEFHN